MKNPDPSNRREASGPAEEPEVGILWLVQGKLVIDSTILSKAKNYGAFKVHPGDHCSVWEKLGRSRAVPADMEYEECPRGRVMYDTKTRRFRLLADKCILKGQNIVSEIIARMKLPRKRTDCGADNHYQCFACLHGKREDTA